MIGIIYLLVTLVADILFAASEPADPPGRGRVSVAAAAGSEARAARRERLHLLRRSPSVLIGAGILLFWIVCAALGNHITPYDPIYNQSPDVFAHPSSAHWFGTDRLGRDVFSRVLAGSREILLVAPAATLLGTVLGTALGLITGYMRGIVDDIVSRLIDAVLALPLIIIAVTAIAALGSRSPWSVAVVIGLVFTPIIARTVRAAVLAERELDYVQAAQLRGEKTPYIMFAEMLPNVMPIVLVEVTVRLGYAIFAVASLTFIGFGIQPPSPDWARADRRQLHLSSTRTGGRCCSRRWRSRRSSSQSTSSPTASSRCSSDERRRSAPRSSARPRRRLPRARQGPPGAARALAPDRGRASRTGSSASPAAASRRRRSRSSATCRETARSRAATIHVAGTGRARAAAERAAPAARRQRLDGLPEPRRGAEPVDSRRRAGRRGVHGARGRARRGAASVRAMRSPACRSPTPAR